MAIYKGFRVQLVTDKTPTATVIAEFGVAAISIVESIPGKSTAQGRTTPGDSTGISLLETYTTERDKITTFARFTAGLESFYNEASMYFPVIKQIDVTDYSSGYIRLLNDTGYYAISQFEITGSSDYFEGYDPNGNRVAATLFGFRFNMSASAFGCNAIAGTLNGDTISSIEYEFSLTGYSSLGATFTSYIFSTVSSALASQEVNFLNNVSQYVPPPTDPYSQGGESDTGGGTGDFDGTSVDIDFASLPTLSAVDTGFITLYNPTLAQLQSLANYMWSGLFDIDTFKKLFADPMQAILGLSIVPGPVPSGTTQNVRIGNIDSGVTMTKAATQYIDIDCGTLNVEEFWGAYLDYEPYTKAEIFLPFIGVHQIAIDDIMNKPVHIKYHIDLLSGGCACEIKCGGSVLYTFIGSCAVSIPVTGSDWTNLLNGVLSAASAIGTMVATGGAAAPAAASTIASAAVNSLKPSIEKSGSIAGAGGLLAGKVPVLILTRPRQALPGKQNTFTGYPAFITRSLGALSGYTEVHSIRLSGIDGTESEIDEIEELLKGGVIL